MDIYKALKREKKHLKRFYIMMIILEITIPLAVYLTGLTTFFYVSYLLFMEILIAIAILNKANYSRLKFFYSNNKLKINSGLLSKENLIFCDKVVLVHTENMEENMEIILITSVNFKNNSLKLIGNNFLKKYFLVSKEYMKIKEVNPESLYYYQIIKRGGLKKYMILDTIYRNCVKAEYTEEGIQNIKIARGQTLV
ncbi:hypothetical protein [Clostridium vincentii]|uniref:Uncharacterized protein n=1 Tax=Clostridium vincentii TaxID=52704 RepID=A0A2T0BGY0_9CLOT|nr:hypothetical protein [Clostridium vincentii]PRR83161.1 hypothetical protein CLVI_12030 [Clostridium vincentii]